MAGLQLTPYLPVGIMFPHNKREAPGLHSTKQDPYEEGDSSLRSSLGQLRNNFHPKLLSNKELDLDNVYTHPQKNTCTKARRYSYPHSAGIHQPVSGSNPQGQGNGLFGLSSPQPRYSKANNQDFIHFTNKRVGVHGAFPLKPMVHNKSRSTGEACTDGDQNVYPQPPTREFSDSNFGLRSWVNSSVLTAMQAEKAMADRHRTEWTEIQILEAAGESLQKEIRRKEMLLREKLKKTEEGLRRIQKEKKQTKENEDEELQRVILPRRRASGSNTTYKPSFSLEFRSKKMFSSKREDEICGRRQENSSPFQFSDYGIQTLKRERLVASNNQIRERDSRPSADNFFQPSEELGSALQRPSLSRTSGSSRSSCSTKEPELGKCSYCGRTFLSVRLERHATVCGRMQGSKRKVFDSSRARAKGTELEQYLNWKGPATVKAEPPQKSTWRQKHESFIRSLRHAREVQQVIARGGNPSDLPPILPAENSDYLQCPHCSRHFAPKVAERHIPKCKTIKNRPPPPRKYDS
ncbi:zinc finger C2HC domain-containing protein 1C [Nannospalax galili]|uniref:Zinc finger, C2HC-type containing 1C n=1 Tax=Nannospalax galili TaxID=1026970 RepID=A0A8C6RIV8_NANGA|nr:zinc finger C2HC domain-containing protein 1C [Nannospalax galili]XP_029410282.1 zinc finger C2HC domain-containing protein 1C [Nannospalax galili]